MWNILTEPLDAVLKKANMTWAEIDTVEIVGMAWRMPRVQQVLNEYLAKAQESRGTKEVLALGQHLNGDETFVLGASLFGANATRAIRPQKRVFFSDSLPYTYSMDILDLADGKQLKNTTEIATPNSRLGLKKKITVNDATKDFSINLMENAKLLTKWKVTGLEDAIQNKYAHLMKGENATSPKVAFTIGPD